MRPTTSSIVKVADSIRCAAAPQIEIAKGSNGSKPTCEVEPLLPHLQLIRVSLPTERDRQPLRVLAQLRHGGALPVARTQQRADVVQHL